MRPGMTGLLVIGVDPGPAAGITALRYHHQHQHQRELVAVVQADPAAARRVVEALLDLGRTCGVPTVLAIESFRPRPPRHPLLGTRGRAGHPRTHRRPR